MADLIVHDIEEDLIRTLCERAVAHKCDLNTEILNILKKMLPRLEKRSLDEILAEIPEIRPGAGTDQEVKYG